jgi:transposase
VQIPAHERQKRGRKKLSAELPRIEIVHDLPEDQKVCGTCEGTALKRIGEESSEQLDYVPAKVRVLKHIRPKYACPCCHAGVKIAPVPVSIFPKSLASPALLAHIATAKFVDHTPLYRQETQWARLGVILGRATMAGWMIRLGTTHLTPLINLLAEHMLALPLIHCDETRLQVLEADPKNGKAPASEHWMWARCAGPPGKSIVLFDYDPSRGGTVPKRLLEGYRGILLTDGYEAYVQVAAAHSLVHAGCWAHARRKFDEAHKANEDSSHAKAALAFIGELSAIERALWDRDRPVTPAQRVAVRQQHSLLILERFRAWLEALSPQVLPESRLGKAVHYTLNQWKKLTVFLEHGEVPLTNNLCENTIRPFVVGRKGWLFCDTIAGAKASATLFSLIETAKVNGLEPHAYLSALFDKLPTLTTVADFEAWLPWNVKAHLAR